MHLARKVVALAALVALVSPASIASANTPEDIQGVGARTNAMGGAGTALPRDFTASYYNPGALDRCTDDHMGVDIRHTMYNLDVDRIGADAPPGTAEPLRDQTRVTTGLCLRFPYNLTLGFMLGVGIQNLMTLDQTQPIERPQFVMYGDSLEQLSIALGFAYRVVDQLSIGIGGSILVNTDISFGATIPVQQDTNPADGFNDPLQVQMRMGIVPTGAPYAGVLVQPIPELRIGLTFRGSMHLDLDVPATIQASVLGLAIPMPMQIKGIGWYTPRQFALGVSADPVRDLTLTADVTFYNWGALAGSYYPFLAVSPAPGYEDGIAGTLGFQRMGRPGWRNTVVPRVGGELRLADQRFAIRGGYSYRPSALGKKPGQSTMPTPDGTGVMTNIVTLLDSNVHSLSFGLGYYFGDRPNEREEEEEEEAPAPSTTTANRTAYVLPYDADGFELEPVDERSAQRTRGGGGTGTVTAQPVDPAQQTTTPTPTTATATAPTPAATAESAPTTAAAPAARGTVIGRVDEEEEEDEDLPGIVGQFDFFARANLFQQQTDTVKDIRYGGTILDIGIQMSLGWY